METGQKETEGITAGHFFAGVIGLGLLRNWYLDTDANGARAGELSQVLANADQFPYSIELNPREQTLLAGYAEWAGSYDGPNPMIDAEQRVVKPMVQRLVTPGCRALDAGCGTGRHAEFLASVGCDTTGFDQSAEMLAVARAKVASARFEQATFDALPFADDSFDLAVSALALCHLADVGPAVRELARVIRPGGSLVIADPHPVGAMCGGQAFYGGINPGKPMTWVRNHSHLASTWLRAFRDAGLTVADCEEVLFDDAIVATNPTSQLFPEATRAAMHGLPYLFVWELRKP